MKLIDLRRQRFGRLVVIERAANGRDGRARWLCRCDCGAEKVVSRHALQDGRTKSCGCLRREIAASITWKHGYGTPTSPLYSTFRIWVSMLDRTTNPRNSSWERYGGRGIGVCDRWNPKRGGNFENFLGDVGPRPSPRLSLDRIDNDRGYEPDNVRWATASQQRRNQRSFANHHCDQAFPKLTYHIGAPELRIIARAA